MATVSVEIGGHSIRAMVRTAAGTHRLELGGSLEQYRVPSAFAKDMTGNVHVGNDAMAWKYHSEFLSIVEVESDERTLSRSICSLAKIMMGRVKKQTAEEIDRLVFIVPDYYETNDPKKSYIKDALFKQGVCDVEFVSAHQALCMRQAYISDNQYVVVFDFGHRGLNISILKRQGTGFEKMKDGRVDSIGGFVFDGLIYRDILEKCDLIRPEDIDFECLWNDEIERLSTFVKESLSVEDRIECPVPCSDKLYSVSRKEFEDMLSPVIGVGYNACQNMIAESNVNAADIVEVLLWGGSCRIPMVLDRCKYLFKQMNPAMRITNCAAFSDSSFLACEGGLLGNVNSGISLSL